MGRRRHDDGRNEARKRRSLVALALALPLAGCGTALMESGLLPTSAVRSVDRQAAPSTQPIAVGVRPPAPAPDMTPAERDQNRAALEAARTRVQSLSTAPLDRPIPP